MKNFFKLALASIILMTSCSKDGELTPQITDDATFYASIEAPSTRTYADENGKLLWTAEDKITIFKGTVLPEIYQFTGATGDNCGGFNKIDQEIGEFITGNDLGANYAIYPHDPNTRISNDGKISYTIPATQLYAENSFGLGANVMVAVTENKADNFLAFKNLGGYFEFSLYGDVKVKSIEFKGNNGEKLAGKATITATYQEVPTFVFADDATETLTLDCGEGVELGADAENATKFWFAVPAITYEEGITITITDTEDKVMEKSTSNSIEIERSTVQPLNAFEVNTVRVTPSSNQIWYTSSDGNIVTPYKTDVFGANIESNTYENGRGVITFEGDITSIGGQAFYNCSSLTSVTIPNSVTSIEQYAFGYCYSLTSVTIPDRVTSIGYYAFNYCSNLTSVTIGNSVTSIEQHAFNSCLNLTSVIIPDSVTSIGDYAFAHCYNLTNATIGNSVASIGNGAFAGCMDLTSVTIPDSVTSIGYSAFLGCSSLTGFYGKFASEDNRCLIIDGLLHSVAPAGLTTFTIPNSVTSTALGLFVGCSDLTSFYGKFASEDNRCFIIDGGLCGFAPAGLTSYTIPNDVTVIVSGSFAGCRSLTSITIPSSVTSIVAQAFAGCDNLTSVYCKPTTPPTLGSMAFGEINSSRKFYVPMGSVNAYKGATNWSNYASSIEGYNF